MRINEGDYLEHWGILGMHWGVTTERDGSSSPTSGKNSFGQILGSKSKRVTGLLKTKYKNLTPKQRSRGGKIVGAALVIGAFYLARPFIEKYLLPRMIKGYVPPYDYDAARKTMDAAYFVRNGRYPTIFK